MLIGKIGYLLPSNALVPINYPTELTGLSASAACMKVAVEAMRRITLDNRDRIKSGDLSKLEKGIFYSHEYAEALSKHDAGKLALNGLRIKRIFLMVTYKKAFAQQRIHRA